MGDDYHAPALEIVGSVEDDTLFIDDGSVPSGHI